MVPYVKECDGDDSLDHVQNTARGIAKVSARGLQQRDHRDVLAMRNTVSLCTGGAARHQDEAARAAVLASSLSARAEPSATLKNTQSNAAEVDATKVGSTSSDIASLDDQIASSDPILTAAKHDEREGDTGFQKV